MIHALISRLPGPFKAMAERFDRSPLDNSEKLSRFVRTRSSFIAQTALFGYLKERMGTQYRDYFQDDVFSAAIKSAAVKVFTSCLADMAVFSAATAATDGRLTDDQAAAMARRFYADGLREGLNPEDLADVPDGVQERFELRLTQTRWDQAAIGESAFTASAEDLVRYAPVVDTFKELDRDIVMNSIRFRWRDVRERLRSRIEPDAVAAEWTDRRAS